MNKIREFFRRTHTPQELEGLKPEIIATIIKLLGAKATGTLEAYVAKLVIDVIEEKVAERIEEKVAERLAKEAPKPKAKRTPKPKKEA